MYEVKIMGFKTPEQAEEFINWYSGQGEQDAGIWFECHKQDGDIDVDNMTVDCLKTFPIKWINNQALMVIEPY